MNAECVTLHKTRVARSSDSFNTRKRETREIMYHMLYAKGPNDKRFAPIEWASGNQVINKMFATMFSEENTAKLREDLPALHPL